MNSSKQTSAVIGLALIFVLSTLVGGYSQGVQFASATTVEEEVEEVNSDIVETQNAATEFVTEDLQEVDGVEYTSRWGPVATIAAGDLAVLLADCNPGEYAAAGQTMFESIFVEDVSSFNIAFEDANLMSWLVLAKNTHESADKDAAAGVICADESGNDDNDDDGLDITVRTALQQAVNRYIIQGGDVDINIQNLVNVVQNITQVVSIVNNITGNNNTIINVINQTASQLANINTTSIDIGQIVNQSAINVVEQSGNQSAIQEVEEEIETPAATAPVSNTTSPLSQAVIEQQQEEEEEETTGEETTEGEETETTTPPTDETTPDLTPNEEEEEEDTTADATTTTTTTEPETATATTPESEEDEPE